MSFYHISLWRHYVNDASLQAQETGSSFWNALCHLLCSIGKHIELIGNSLRTVENCKHNSLTVPSSEDGPYVVFAAPFPPHSMLSPQKPQHLITTTLNFCPRISF